MELRNYVDALEAFTNAIKLNPNMAEVLTKFIWNILFFEDSLVTEKKRYVV